MRMPGPGVYECRAFVYSGEERVGRSARVELPDALRITVLESVADQVFDLDIPQAAVDAATERAVR